MDKILTISDFTGIYELPISSLNTDRATAILNKVEADIFRKMMGDDAYRRSILSCYDIDIEGELSLAYNPDFEDFFGGVTAYEVDGVYKLFDEGFKNAILSFAWYEIMRDFHQFSSSNGIFEALAENAQPAANRASVLCYMWNNGVRIYNDAYRYIVDYMIGVLGLDADGEIFENFEHEPIEERAWI
ncbi:MAG: hypothetical protein RBS24_05895 [Bacilli bacterium]|jgi:hypothetical protein|nr:hypothetical protein [Bacilli bacterium]